MRFGISMMPISPWGEVVDRLLRGVTDDWHGRWYNVSQAAVAPLPVQQPRPSIIVGANHRRMIEVAARRADVWNTWGGHGIDEAAFLDRTRQRVELTDRACEEAGRDPATLGRSALVHFGAFNPWRSRGEFERIVQLFADLGFDECLMYWPQSHERAVFDEVAEHVITGTQARRSPPAGGGLRGAAAESG